MLSVPAPYPHPGSHAFTVPEGKPCRILQARADGRLLIALTGVSATHPDLPTRASGNRTVDRAEVAETMEEARDPKARRQPRRRTKSRARKVKSTAHRPQAAGGDSAHRPQAAGGDSAHRPQAAGGDRPKGLAQ